MGFLDYPVADSGIKKQLFSNSAPLDKREILAETLMEDINPKKPENLVFGRWVDTNNNYGTFGLADF